MYVNSSKNLLTIARNKSSPKASNSHNSITKEASMLPEQSTNL